MFLSTMNTIVSGSTAPMRTNAPFVLSRAGATRSDAAERAVHVAPERTLHAAGDRIDLGSQPRRQPLITGLAPMPGLRQGASNISPS